MRPSSSLIWVRLQPKAIRGADNQQHGSYIHGYVWVVCTPFDRTGSWLR